MPGILPHSAIFLEELTVEHWQLKVHSKSLGTLNEYRSTSMKSILSASGEIYRDGWTKAKFKNSWHSSVSYDFEVP